MKNPLLVTEFNNLIKVKDFNALSSFFEEVHPIVSAELISSLHPDESWKVLQNIRFPLRSEIFSKLSGDRQLEIIEILKRDEIALLLADMPPDDRVDLFKSLPEEKGEFLLPALAQAEREDIR